MKRIYQKLEKLEKPLFHITEFENLESILKEGGLFSLKKILEKGIEAKYMTSPESRSIDQYKGINDYVRLAYTPLYDMFPCALNRGELENPCIIKININVLNEKKGNLFTTENAVSKSVKYYNQEVIGDYMDWIKVFSKRNMKTVKGEHSKEYKNARQSEVLIKNTIEKEYFTEIIVNRDIDISMLKEYNIEIKQKNVKKIIGKFG